MLLPDIDECSVLSNACTDAKPFCVNTQGSYACLEITGVKSCPAGFKYDKPLQQCKGNELLYDNIVLYLSRLFLNFFLSIISLSNSKSNSKRLVAIDKMIFFNLLTCQSDVDECAEDIHSCLADVEECRNTEGAYECDMKCEKGFTYSISLGICVGECRALLLINRCKR